MDEKSCVGLKNEDVAKTWSSRITFVNNAVENLTYICSDFKLNIKRNFLVFRLKKKEKKSHLFGKKNVLKKL